MAAIVLKVSRCILNLLMINLIVQSIGAIPLCGTMDGSFPSRDGQEIHFKDTDQGIQTVEMGGTIVGCYPTSKKAAASPPSMPRSFIADVSKCAKHQQNYCTKDDNYPTEYVNYVVQKHWRMLAYAFGSDSIPNDNRRFDVRLNRIRRSVNGNDLCDSHERIIYPTSGKRLDGTELYIFNTAEHEQGVSTSVCVHNGKSCRLTDNFPNYYRTECKQHYVYRELLALSPDGVPVKEKFEFPTYCSCAVSHGP